MGSFYTPFGVRCSEHHRLLERAKAALAFLYALRREVLRNQFPARRTPRIRRRFLYALRREVLRNAASVEFARLYGLFLYALRREVLRNKREWLGPVRIQCHVA